MLKFERILCPVDFSEPSIKAYDYAYSLALHYGAQLYLECAVEPVVQGFSDYSYSLPDRFYERARKEAEDRLRAMANSESGKRVRTEVVVHIGFATQSILSFAEDHRVDLIVIGTHGRRGLDRLVMGSVTEYVLRRASCPVLAVRTPAHDFVNPAENREPVSLRKLLLCTDFSEYAANGLKYALSLAQEYNAELSLLHVIEKLPEGKVHSAMEEAREKLDALIPDDVRNWCTVRPVVRMDDRPYQEIIQFAVEQQTDLAILGVRGRNAVDLAVFGSTTHRVIQLGPCPVLTVRGDTA